MDDIRSRIELREVADEIDEIFYRNESDSVHFNTNFEFVVGYRSGSNLLWVPSDNCFYKQNVYSKTYNGIAYRCYDNNCTARKVVTEDNILLTISESHIPHPEMYNMYKELHYLNLMKDMCRTEPLSVKVSDIYKQVSKM